MEFRLAATFGISGCYFMAWIAEVAQADLIFLDPGSDVLLDQSL